MLRLNGDTAVEGLIEGGEGPVQNSNEAGRWKPASQPQVCKTEHSALGWVRGGIPGKKHLARTCTCVKTPHGFIGSSRGSDPEPTQTPVSEQAEASTWPLGCSAT